MDTVYSACVKLKLLMTTPVVCQKLVVVSLTVIYCNRFVVFDVAVSKQTLLVNSCVNKCLSFISL